MMRKLGQKGKRGLSLLLALLFCLAPIPFNFNFTPKVEASWPEGDVITNYPFNPGVPPATVEDLAWDIHDHPGYERAYTQSLSSEYNKGKATPNHVVLDKSDISFFGYGNDPYMDYVFIEDMYENLGNAFIMRPVNMNFHTFSETGYLFNGTMQTIGGDNYYTGYAIILQCNNSAGMQESDATAPNTAALRLYYIDNELWDTEKFKPGNVLGARELITTFKTNINNFDSTPFRVNVEIDPATSVFNVYIDGDLRATVEMKSDKVIGSGFGFYTGYYSHGCSILTRIRYEDVVVNVKPLEGEAKAEIYFVEQGTGKELRMPEYEVGEIGQKYKIAQPKKIEFEGKTYYLVSNKWGASIVSDIIRMYSSISVSNVTILYYVLPSVFKESLSAPEKNARVNGDEWKNGYLSNFISDYISVTSGDEIEYNITIYSPPLPEPAMMAQGISGNATTFTWFNQPSTLPAIQKQLVKSLEFVDLPEYYTMSAVFLDDYSYEWEGKPVLKIWDATFTAWDANNPKPRVFAWVVQNDDGINYDLFIGGQGGVQAPIDCTYLFYYFNNLETLNMENFDASNVTNASYMFYGCSSLTEFELTNLDTKNVTNMSYMFGSCSSLTELDLTGLDTKNVTDMSSMFNGCTNLINLDLSPLDVSQVISMQNMFSSCHSLTEIDLSPLSTASPTNIASMFSWCESLTSIDLSPLNTANVTSMNSLFGYCYGLSSIDLSPLDTTNVTTMANMFTMCNGLTNLDLSPLNTSNVTSMAGMFNGCSGLTELDLSPLDTSKVTTMQTMFCGCSGLTELDLTPLNTSNVTTMQQMFLSSGLMDINLSVLDMQNVTNINSIFQNCSSLETINMSGVNMPKISAFTNAFSGCTNLKEIDLSNAILSGMISMNNMFGNISSVEKINLRNANTSNTTSMQGMFQYCSSLTDIDFTGIDTSKVTAMNSLFDGCSSLKSIDLSPLNTSSVTTMYIMFRNCTGLTSLDLSPLDTTNVTNMSSMFNGCSGLTEIDLSPLDTTNATDISSMFSGCSSLTEIDLSPFDTSNVTTLYGLFSGCSSLKEIDLSPLDTSKVTTISSMFLSCSGLTEIDLSPLNTSNVTAMQSLFAYCSSLTEIDISPLDTSKVTNIQSMFHGCSSLLELDLSSLDMSNITSLYSMFNGCSNLTSLDLSCLDVSKVGSVQYMFQDCTSLIDLNMSGVNLGGITNNTGVANLFTNCIGLKTLNLSNVNISKITSLAGVFPACVNLEDLDLSGSDLSGLTSIASVFAGMTHLTTLNMSNTDLQNATNITNWLQGCTSLKTLDMSGADMSKITSISSWLSACSNLEELDLGGTNLSGITATQNMFPNMNSLTSLNINGADLSSVTNAYRMFEGCNNLTSLDLSGINMPNATNMSGLFYDCTSLAEIDLSGLNTSNVTNMAYMFTNCASLTDIDLSNFDTSNVTDMSMMFYHCSGLTDIDLSPLDTSNVTNVQQMFNGCSGLTDIDLSTLDTSSVTDMLAMFSYCDGLTSLDLSMLDTSNVLSMSNMFGWCTNLTDLDLSGLDTSSVTNTYNMFRGCTSLTTLDLSSFDTSSVTNTGYMFYDCTDLLEIHMENADFSAVSTSSTMFTGCNPVLTVYVGNAPAKTFLESLSPPPYLVILAPPPAPAPAPPPPPGIEQATPTSLSLNIGDINLEPTSETLPSKSQSLLDDDIIENERNAEIESEQKQNVENKAPTELDDFEELNDSQTLEAIETENPLGIEPTKDESTEDDNGTINGNDVKAPDGDDEPDGAPVITGAFGFTPPELQKLPGSGTLDTIYSIGFKESEMGLPINGGNDAPEGPEPIEPEPQIGFEQPQMAAKVLTGTVTVTDDVPAGLLIDPLSITTGDGITHTIVDNLITWEIPVEMLPVDLSYKVTVLSNTTGTKYENTATATYKNISATSNTTYHEYSSTKLTVIEQYYIFGTTTELDEPNITVYDGTNTHNIKGSLSNLNGYEYCGYEIDGGGYIDGPLLSPMTLSGNTTITLYYKPVSSNPTVTIYFVDSAGTPLKDYIFQAVHNNSDWYIPQSYMVAIDTPTGTWTYYGFKLTEPSDGPHETPGGTPTSPISKDPDGLELPIFADITDDVAITLYFAKQTAVTVRFVERGNESNILKNTETYFGSTTPDTSPIDLTEENGKTYTYSSWYSVDGGPEQYGDPGLITGSHEITLFFETHYTVTEYFVSYVRYINDEDNVEIYIDSLDDPAEHDNIAQGTPFQGNPQSFPGYTYIGYCFDNGYNEIYEGEPDPFDVYGDTVIIYLYSKDYVPIYTPTIDKNIVPKPNKYVKSNTYAIGDAINFMLQIELPDDLDEYLDYTLIVHDEFGGTAVDPYISYDLTGMDYLDEFAVYAWDGLDPATKDEFTDYTLAMAWPTFDIDFDFNGLLGVPEGMSLLIEFASIINQSFEDVMESTNTAWLEYTDEKTLGTIDLTDESTVWFATSGFDDWWKVDGDSYEDIEEQLEFVKIDDPNLLPTNSGRGASFSPDGKYLAVAYGDGMMLYDFSAGYPVKTENPDNIPLGFITTTAFSPNGKWLAVGNEFSPFITLFDMTSNAKTKIDDPDVSPTGATLGIAFSSDSSSVAVAHYEAPFITLYKVIDGCLIKQPGPDIPPNSYCYAAAFSPDNKYLVFAQRDAPGITIYDISGSSPAIVSPDVAPSGTGTGVAFSPNGEYLAVSTTSSPYITIYDMTGIIPTKIPNPSPLPTGLGYGVAFSPNGQYLVVSHVNNPRITIYELSAGTLNKVSNPDVLPTGEGNYGPAFSPDNKFLAVPHLSSPYISIYSTPHSASSYNQLISNAEFTLQKLTPRTTPDVNGLMYDIGTPLTFTDSNITGKPAVYDNDPSNSDTTNIFTSTPEISVAGLAPGLYMLQEISAPGDYDLLGYNIFIEITMEFDPITETWTTVKRLFHDTTNEFLYSTDMSGFNIFENTELDVHETVYVENFMPDFATPVLELFIDDDGDYIKGLGTGVGETVNFAINATVPNLLGQFADYTYIVHNEFTGPSLPFLGFDETGEDYLSNIEVFIWKDDDLATKEPILSGYNVTQSWPGFDVEFDFATLQSIPKGYDILIEYSTVVNVNVVETLEFTSNVWLEYSDDPNDLMSAGMTEPSSGCVKVACLDDVWKVDGTTKTVKEGTGFIKINNPDIPPTGIGSDVAFSPNSQYLAVTYRASPYMSIFDMTNGTPTKIAGPNDPPTDMCFSAAFSPNGQYLAIGHNAIGSLIIYNMTTEMPTRISGLSAVPGGINHLSFSPNGQYLALASTAPPYITVYDMLSSPPVKLANPDILPEGRGCGVAFSPDGHYLAVAHYVSPFVTIYDMTGGIPTKITDPDFLPAGETYNVAFSPNGKILAVAVLVSPFITIYDMTNGYPIKMPGPAELPPSQVLSVSFSPDGKYMATGHNAPPNITIYDITSGAPTKIPNPDILPNGIPVNIDFSPDGQYLAAATQGQPYVAIYRTPTPATTSYSTLLPNAQFALYQLTPRDTPNVNGNMYDIGLPLAFTDTPFGTSLYDGDPTNATTFTTLVSDPEITALGLAPGTYMLRETKAPDGYDRLTYDVFFEITLEYDDITNEWLYIKKAVKDVNDMFLKASVPPDYITIYDSTDGTEEPLYIENFSGDIFPEVGGIGTTVFYLTSLLLTTGLALFAIKSRKRKAASAA